MVLFSGQVPTKLRGDIVNDFNREGRGAQVMLLSLGAGGVGLNLVGANHLFLLDMHWNPQLESQARLPIFLSTVRAPGIKARPGREKNFAKNVVLYSTSVIAA